MNKSLTIILSFLVISMGFNTVHAIELEQHTNIRGDAVFINSDSVEKLLERGYLVNNSVIIETSYDLSERWVHVPEYTEPRQNQKRVVLYSSENTLDLYFPHGTDKHYLSSGNDQSDRRSSHAFTNESVGTAWYSVSVDFKYKL